MNPTNSVYTGRKNAKINHLLRIAKFFYFVTSVALFLLYFKIVIVRYGYTDHLMHPKAFLLFSVIYVLALLWFIRIYNGFYFGFSGIGELIFSQSISTCFVNFIIYVLVCIYINRFIGMGYLLLLCLIDIINNTIFSFIGQSLYFHFTESKRTAVIYRNSADLNKLSEIYLYPHYFNVSKYIKNPEDPEKVISELVDTEIVIIAGIRPHIRNGILKYCIQHGIQAYIEPKIGDVIMAGSRRAIGFSIPIMKVGRVVLTPEFRFFKRLADIVISFSAIILLSPFMLISAILIKADDHGPVFYRQTRLTKDGKKFEILKFRSMRVDAEGDGVARLASENDDRITRIGHFLRACRMDELPQLFNVLKGDMSIVGPRPERPEIAEQYMKEISSFDLRLQVKAGITGFAQVYGKYNTEPYDKLQLDLMYINNMSLLNDLWLMFATFKVLFQKESTSGVEAGQITAVREDDYSAEVADEVRDEKIVGV